jgi:hypothetical protein
MGTAHRAAICLAPVWLQTCCQPTCLGQHQSPIIEALLTKWRTRNDIHHRCQEKYATFSTSSCF